MASENQGSESRQSARLKWAAYLTVIYITVRGNKNEFIDQNKELCPNYYDSHMYTYFHMTVFVCLYWP